MKRIKRFYEGTVTSVFSLWVILLACPFAYAEKQISQFGITWTFDREYTVGQFVNGDYWVIGPVTIIGIDPPSTEINGRTMNGSMVNPSPKLGSTQGYDSAMYGGYGPHFDPNLNVGRPNNRDLSASNPLIVERGCSLVSTISIPEPGHRPQLKTAAVLTVVVEPATEGSFRPAYCGNDKTIKFNKNQLNYSLLANLKPVPNRPPLAKVERYFERPWIDHIPGWIGRYHHPAKNMRDYGREIATQVGIGALMLHLNFTSVQKAKLLVRYVQLGIDLYGIVQNGGADNWVPDGGHASGRKWPILLAGLILDDADMKSIGVISDCDDPNYVHFGEDDQTFYMGEVPEWGIRHTTVSNQDNPNWGAPYRQCCTANAWAGFVLAAHIMGMKELWNDDALFNYMDRYMRVQKEVVGVGNWKRQWSRFSENMWDFYRPHYGPVWTMSPALNITAIGGSVKKIPDKAAYILGEEVILKAVADAGYKFTGWSGDLVGTENPIRIIMHANRFITAKFAISNNPPVLESK